MNGNGRAFYEIGVADNGINYGITKSMIYETMAVLFHNARKLEEEDQKGLKEIVHEIQLVRKGLVDKCYSVQVKIESIYNDVESLQSSIKEASEKQ